MADAETAVFVDGSEPPLRFAQNTSRVDASVMYTSYGEDSPQGKISRSTNATNGKELLSTAQYDRDQIAKEKALLMERLAMMQDEVSGFAARHPMQEESSLEPAENSDDPNTSLVSVDFPFAPLAGQLLSWEKEQQQSTFSDAAARSSRASKRRDSDENMELVRARYQLQRRLELLPASRSPTLSPQRTPQLSTQAVRSPLRSGTRHGLASPSRSGASPAVQRSLSLMRAGIDEFDDSDSEAFGMSTSSSSVGMSDNDDDDNDNDTGALSRRRTKMPTGILRSSVKTTDARSPGRGEVPATGLGRESLSVNDWIPPYVIRREAVKLLASTAAETATHVRLATVCARLCEAFPHLSSDQEVFENVRLWVKRTIGHLTPIKPQR